MKSVYTVFCCLFFPLFSFAQKVSGLITDAQGKPLPYASISVKNSTRGTNANSEGRYFIELTPGPYILVCQYVNYQKEERAIVVGPKDLTVDFALSVQETMMDTVIIKQGPNPALEIIRNTIKKRPYHQAQLDDFECEVYTKGLLRVRDYPKKIFGKKVDFEDGDTSKNKILFLSETISHYAVEKPQKEKIEVLSSKVSGQSDGYGLSAPKFFSFYDNNIFIGNNLNPRGFISPISDNAMNFYKYKYEGEFSEDGKQIIKILVTPKRKFEPLFSGYINIIEDEWSIHSLQLKLTKQSQMQIIDSLVIEQLYRPLEKDVWVISCQMLYPSVRLLGFDAHGSFINIYSDFDINPTFTKRSFNNTILKYLDSSNKKTNDYWDQARPIPLMPDEIRDYYVKDSLEYLRRDPRYLDSLEKERNKLNLFGALLFEQTYVTESRKTVFSFRPITEQVSFNPAEGLVINTGATWTKKLDSSSVGTKSITIAPNLRYGFTNKHFNGHLTVGFNFGRKYARSLTFSGGKRIFQFNNYSPIGPRGNSLSSLLGENNRMKTYEAIYFRGSYNQGIGDGFSWTAAFQYQDRMPLDNRTDYTWRDRKDVSYTPNYPSELVSENIRRHQVFVVLLRMNWQPGTKYIEMPDRKINIGSKYPMFSIQYTRSIDRLFGSDADFDKWRFTVRDDLNFRLKGTFSYRIGVGGFIDNDKVPIPDYHHFNGNISTFATEYLNSFQALPLYQYSNTGDFYSLYHIQHNFNGFLTNKIPGLRALNLYLVLASNGFYVDKNLNYVEYSAGFDNIFKQFRFDYVMSHVNGVKQKSEFRIGFRRTFRPRGDDWP